MGDKKALMELNLRNEFMPLDECTDMEIDDNDDGGMRIEGEASDGNVVFSREGPLVSDEPTGMLENSCTCGASKKMKSRPSTSESEPGSTDIGVTEKKLSRQDRIELGRMFQAAVSCRDWELAESLILLADPQTLNDSLCISLDSVWFLSTEEELFGITGIIKKVIANGAYDFTRAALRTSFLASCVSACQSRTMSLADTVSVMAER